MSTQTVYVIQADVKSPAQQEFTTKYISYDAPSGGYPYWPEHMKSACLHNKLDDTLRMFEYIKKATHTTYRNGPTAAYDSHEIPFELKAMFDGPSVTGTYVGRVRVIAISGTWGDIKTETLEDQFFEATSNNDTPNTMPTIVWKPFMDVNKVFGMKPMY